MRAEWGVYQIEVPISAVFAVQPWNSVEYPQDYKDLMVDGQHANVGIRIVFPIRSSSLATGVPVLVSTGTSPVAVGVAS